MLLGFPFCNIDNELFFLLVFLYNALSMWYLNPSVSQIFHVCAQQIRQSSLFLQVKLIKCN